MSRIEIHYGMVQEAYVTDGAGKRPLFSEVGQYLFFIDLVETDGTRIGMHDCKSYEEAIKVAHELAVQWKCQVHDLVSGGAA